MSASAAWGIAALLIVALVVFALRRRASQVPRDKDLAVLGQLQKAGSDMTKPHTPEFFLYFPKEDSAREASRRLEAEGYAVKVEPSASGDGMWLCLATKSMIPRHETLAAIRQRLEDLASELGGEYNGWGTPIVT